MSDGTMARGSSAARSLGALLIAAMVSAPAATQPQAIYRELFPNDTGSNYGLSDPRGGASGWYSNFTYSGSGNISQQADPSRPYPTFTDSRALGTSCTIRTPTTIRTTRSFPRPRAR